MIHMLQFYRFILLKDFVEAICCWSIPFHTVFPAYPTVSCVLPCLLFSLSSPPFSLYPCLSSSPSVSQSGHVVCVLVEDWETLSSYSHSVGVRKVFPDLNGTRLVFIDNKNSGFLLSPVRTYGYLTHLYMRTHSVL